MTLCPKDVKLFVWNDLIEYHYGAVVTESQIPYPTQFPSPKPLPETF